MGWEIEVQAEVPVGHWKARLRRAERAREERWCCACASDRPLGALDSASCIANAGRNEKAADKFPRETSSSSSYSRRKTSPPCCPPPSSPSRPSNPQYSLKNISPSSSVIFLTLTGFVPAPIRAAISCRLCMTCGSGRCAGGGKAASLLCACAEVA